uniref:mitogen-activated protein kinase kinase n=1 Tax=Acrobeloides nanus TaxID=290746 RepID=A0A914EI22_9BILA
MDMSLMDLASQSRLKKKDLPVPVLGYLSFIVIDTLEQCIKRRIIHRDIKPTNILINKNGLVKLCDFGQARKIIDEASTLKGTPQYWPPECWDNNGETEYDERRDIWSYGITILELIYGDSPYKDYRGQQIDWISGEHVKNANGRQLVEKCLEGKEKIYAEMRSFLLQTLETYINRRKYDVLKKDKFIQTYSIWTPEMFKKELELSELMNDSSTTSNRLSMESIDNPQEKKLSLVQEELMKLHPNDNISSQSDDTGSPLIPSGQNTPRIPSLESQRSSQSDNSRSLLIPPGQESGNPPRRPCLESQSNETLSEDSKSRLVLCHGMSKKYILRSLAIVVFLLLLSSPIYIWYFLLREHEKSETTTTSHSTLSTISPRKCLDSFSYFPATKACYYVNYGNSTWKMARFECLGLFRYPHRIADLVSIHNETEDKYVKELAPDSKLIAIGLYASDGPISSEVDYKWVDSTPKSYTNWKTEPGVKGGEHCVYKELDGKWNVYDCNKVADIAYVCKHYP